jgi:hypothetical protein
MRTSGREGREGFAKDAKEEKMIQKLKIAKNKVSLKFR